MQARGLLNYRLKFCWLKVISCVCQSNELKREIMHKYKLEGPTREPKLVEHGPSRPPLESPLFINPVGQIFVSSAGKREAIIPGVFHGVRC